MSLYYHSFNQDFALYMKREDSISHRAIVSKMPSTTMTRIDGELDEIAKKLTESRDYLGSLHDNLDTAKAELGKDFPREQELQDKQKRLAEVTAVLEAKQELPGDGFTPSAGQLDEVRESAKPPETAAEVATEPLKEPLKQAAERLPPRSLHARLAEKKEQAKIENAARNSGREAKSSEVEL